MSLKPIVNINRRRGQDRRETEAGPPTDYERRRAVEARLPELIELHLSEEELRELGFAQNRPVKPKPD
jgi:hypothetical protein